MRFCQNREQRPRAPGQLHFRQICRSFSVAVDQSEFVSSFFGGFFTVKAGHNRVRKLHLCVHGVQHSHIDFLLKPHNHGGSEIREQLVVGPHQFVRDRHQLAEHLIRSFGDADVVAQALRHLALAIEAHEDRHGKHHLSRQTVFALDVPVHEQIEFLFGGAEFHVGFERHRIVGR